MTFGNGMPNHRILTRKIMYPPNIAAFIDLLRLVEDDQGMVDLCSNFYSELGFEQWSVMRFVDHRLSQLIISNWNLGRIDEWTERNRDDAPLWRYAERVRVPFLIDDQMLDDEALASGIQHRLRWKARSGLIYPFFNSRDSGLWLAIETSRSSAWTLEKNREHRGMLDGSAYAVINHVFVKLAPGHVQRQISFAGLSPREQEVALWTMRGKTALEIAMILEIAERTVNSHIATIVRKLEASNKTEAIAKAIRIGLVG